MTKNVTVWAVKLNSTIVELRATSSPVKIIRSSIKKVVKVDRWDYRHYPPKKTPVDKVTVYKQTYFMGGRLLGKTSPEKLRQRIGELSFIKDDVVKLTTTQAATVLSLKWRKENL